MHQLVVLATFVSILLTGCGSSTQKLTAEQKNTLKETNKNAALAYQVATSKASLPQGSEALGITLATPSQPDSTINFNRQAMDSRLEQSFNQGLCTMNQDLINPRSGAFEIAGEQCPLTVRMQVLPAEDSAINIHFSLSLLSPDFKKYSDITALTFTVNAKPGPEQTFIAHLDSSFKSQKLGDVRCSMNVKGTPQTSEGVLKYEFPNFAAEIKFEGKEGKHKYFLNGDEITKEEAESYSGFLGGLIQENI